MLKKYFDLEASYDLNKIKISDLLLWPYLRIYFGYKLVYKNMIAGKTIDFHTASSILSTLVTGFKHLFRKYDYLFLTASEQRRKIGEKFYSPFDYVREELGGKSLFFETLFPVNHKIKSIPTPYRTSKSLLLALEFLLIKLLVIKTICHAEILDEINKENNLNINYKFYARRFYAQYLIGKVLAKIYKPKAAFFLTPYTNLGYVTAFKKAGTKTFELQHGVINNQHLGYNPSVYFGESYTIDYLLTYGSTVAKVFHERNSYINCNNIYPIGHFYLDFILKCYEGDSTLLALTAKFKKVIAVSAEYDFEDEIIPFVNKVALKSKESLFVYMPRNKKASDYQSLQFTSNFVIVDWLNSYQIMFHADFHTCVRSTTALEAVSLGIQNILIDIRGYSRSYFKDSLTNSRITVFVDNEEQYLSALQSLQILPSEEIIASDNNFIKPNFKENIRNVIHHLLP